MCVYCNRSEQKGHVVVKHVTLLKSRYCIRDNIQQVKPTYFIAQHIRHGVWKMLYGVGN